jgi:hypothetical protein
MVSKDSVLIYQNPRRREKKSVAEKNFDEIVPEKFLQLVKRHN